MTSTRHMARQAGFTLLEVMLALGLLVGALTVLLVGTTENIARSHNAYLMGVAADLARGKMYDIEEQLMEDGFQELDKEEQGTFEEEGWKKISWKSKVEKIELPSLQSMAGMANNEGEDGQQGADGKDGDKTKPTQRSGSGGMMDTLSAMGGGGAEGAQQAGAMAAYFPMFKNLLEQTIRRITLEVSWKVGGEQQKFVVQMYVTNPAGVTRAMLGGGTGTGSGSGSTSSTGTKTNSRSTSSSRGTSRK